MCEFENPKNTNTKRKLYHHVFDYVHHQTASATLRCINAVNLHHAGIFPRRPEDDMIREQCFCKCESNPQRQTKGRKEIAETAPLLQQFSVTWRTRMWERWQGTIHK